MDFRRVPQMGDVTAQPQWRPAVNGTLSAPPRPVQPVAKQGKKHKLQESRKSQTLTALAGMVVIIALCFAAYWWFALRSTAVSSPFSAKVMASVQFPLYYPTQLPAGYEIDSSSLTEPQQGVIVFNLIGPNKDKIYLSEEARPQSFDLGGFYNKWDDMKEVGVSDGAVAVGRIHGSQTEVASRANNKTWILSNTNAQIPFGQLQSMMKSLTLSY